MKILAGLGNPGQKYSSTRHNIGFWVLDLLAREHGVLLKKGRHSAETGRLDIADQKVILVKPLTYMNNSGQSVAPLMRYHRAAIEDLVVMHDDLDLPLGTMKFALGSSSGGHHGVESLIQHLQSKDFVRLRLGIGRPAGSQDVVDFVLSAFLQAEQAVADDMVLRAGKAVLYYLNHGLTEAMQEFNSRS